MNGIMGLLGIVAGCTAVLKWNSNREIAWVASGLTVAFFIAAWAFGDGGVQRP
jgi:hypothetical protein